MFRFRTTALALGLGITMVANAFAATPEEQAVFREEARRLTEQAESLRMQADDSRDSAKENFRFGLLGAFGLENQATARLVGAYQKWLQGGAKNYAKGSILRQSARSLQLAAYKSEVLAIISDLQADDAQLRANSLRAAAEALLASGNDAETRAIAKDLVGRAARDDKEAESFEKQAEKLRQSAEITNEQADKLIEQAIRLEGVG